ncbi:hypothetical protein ACOSQ2_009317 [Xanthoceras sorbifolium]
MSSSSSSSSSITTRIIKYDVFLSFRGEDTRNKFTSHLHKALCDKQIQTFIDYKVSRGDEISSSLLKAIEKSQISVVVFSQNYASSRWCLEELAKIIECKNAYGQIVVPIFYEVDPSDVRNQTGSFADAFAKHEQRFQENLDRVQRWKDALKEAANLSGSDSRVIKPESVLVEDIVKFILKKLNDMSPSDNKDLVGIDLKIKEIESLLHIETPSIKQVELLLNERRYNVHAVGIWGIGGIGKTTLAEAVFNKISHQFEGSYFIRNVREESEQSGGLNRLQEKLLSAILGDENVNIGASSIGRTFLRIRFGRKKLLIVFDDATDFQQIGSLIGGLDCLGLGSRIIITTRDKQVLRNCRVDHLFEVQGLIHNEAHELFCHHAFRRNHAPLDYGQLSNRVVKYCGGVPLALKVLGSFLLHKRKEVWESAVNKLKKIPDKDVQKVLKISYDGLDDEEQKIFLDIACFFKGRDKDFVINILNAVGISTEIGVIVLIDKCLITISNNSITMHDLLQAMGREIVRQESFNYPGKRSRLWHHDDIYDVFTKNTGTKAIEGISLDMTKARYIRLNPHAFEEMRNLRFLEFHTPPETENKNNVHVSEQGLESVFTELSYLRWDGCPLKSLQSNIHAENLVALDMPYSNVEQLWSGVQDYSKLIHINLSHSELLVSIDLSLVPNIESLILEGCTSLCEISSSSVLYLDELLVLNLTNCKNLRSLPTTIHSKSLKKLVLSGCWNLKTCPQISCNIEELFLDETAIEELPSSIKNLCRLVTLSLRSCSRLKSLSSNICKLKSLKHIDLSGCSELDKLPDNLGALESLKEFNAAGTAIRVVPSSIGCLKNLERLSFEGCKCQESLGLVLPPLLGLHRLTDLRLSDCGMTDIPESLGHLSSLKTLCLGRNNFESIPASFINLSKLLMLDISYCNKLQVLPELPLTCIDAHGCKMLEALPSLSILGTIGSKDGLITVRFINCFKLDRNELRDIVKDALQRLGTLWKKGCYNKQYTETLRSEIDFPGSEWPNWSRIPRVGICFPGSEIPDWFNFQNTGCFITIKLRSGWFSNNFIGFAMCAVVAFRNYQDDGRGLYVRSKCTLERQDGRGNHIGYGSLYEQYSGYHDGPRCISSDHVFMGFDFFMYPRDNGDFAYKNRVAFQVYLSNSKCCEVKRCGVCLLYDRDVGEFSGSFSFAGDKEEPHPKRLKFL